MRRLRYVVAASLDGYISGPKGEADWIVMDPDIDFAALFAQFDTFFIGRGTYEQMLGRGPATPGIKSFVFSRTLQQVDHPDVTIVGDDADDIVAAVKAQEGKDIWLFGGGALFASLLKKGHVDTVEVSIIPVLLGGGRPLLPPPVPPTKLTLTSHKIYKTGIVSLIYDVNK